MTDFMTVIQKKPYKKRLITSALPYVNNVPHLGNLIQVLSADVFARFCRSRGYDTLYICGTDEYGTATETRAREEGVSPRELCTRYHEIHAEIYDWFGIKFDKFGRTSTDAHSRITQEIFLRLYDNGYVQQRTIQQLYSNSSQMFLADRYVRGTCPRCNYEHARGDQCENCGVLLDPMELIHPVSALEGDIPVVKETTHLYIDLPAVLPLLQQWLHVVIESGHWAKNAVKMTEAWIRDGLKERAITRDLQWGIPVPLKDFENKVFYVWFDAPIGYISITASHMDEWESWWKNPDNVELFQFIGKDNIPFHTVVFPSSLLGGTAADTQDSSTEWTMLHHLSSSEYLNYEGGQFSKSRGVGVFGTDVKDTGIPADVWRFYMLYNRPETSDYTFTWSDFQEKVNGELIGNFANLVNRTLTFLYRYFDGVVQHTASKRSTQFWKEMQLYEERITNALEWAKLRDAFRLIFELSSYGNRMFQASEPWKLRKTDTEAAHALLSDLVYLIRDISILIAPYLPETAAKVSEMLGVEEGTWSDLGIPAGLHGIQKPAVLFQLLEDAHIETLCQRFSGTQADRKSKQDIAQQFAQQVTLRVAKILSVSQHEAADKLFVETVDDGSRADRVIVSGLVSHYKPEDLQGKHVILVDNLKPARLRGVKSEGMLLAASSEDMLEVLFVESVSPGTLVLPEGASAAETPKRITIDTFFETPIYVKQNTVYVGDKRLMVGTAPLKTKRIADGSVS